MPLMSQVQQTWLPLTQGFWAVLMDFLKLSEREGLVVLWANFSMRRRGCSIGSLKRRAGFSFELSFPFFRFLFLWLDGITHDGLRLMFMVEMVLDEFSCVAFMRA